MNGKTGNYVIVALLIVVAGTVTIAIGVKDSQQAVTLTTSIITLGGIVLAGLMAAKKGEEIVDAQKKTGEKVEVVHQIVNNHQAKLEQKIETLLHQVTALELAATRSADAVKKMPAPDATVTAMVVEKALTGTLKVPDETAVLKAAIDQKAVAETAIITAQEALNDSNTLPKTEKT